jgi:A/G-specific adenine glycosylase
MDLGATICRPRSPACGICPWRPSCAAHAAGIAAELPRRAAKPARPLRRGWAYLARRPDGSVLVERRPDRGLLGGMLGLPGSDWAEQRPPPAPPLPAAWTEAGVVRHGFTHFALELSVLAAEVGADAPGDYVAADPRSLPAVMRKAMILGLAMLPAPGAPQKGRDSVPGHGAVRP